MTPSHGISQGPDEPFSFQLSITVSAWIWLIEHRHAIFKVVVEAWLFVMPVAWLNFGTPVGRRNSIFGIRRPLQDGGQL